MKEVDELVSLRNKVAHLESHLDMLLAERAHLDKLLVQCGFVGGVSTLMKTVEEVINSGELEGGFGEDFIPSNR